MNIFFFRYIGSLWSTLMQSSSINFSYLKVLYSSRLHISQNKQLWLNEFTHLSSLLWLSAVCTHYYIGCMNILLCIVCIIIHFILLADDLPYVSTIYILYYANGDQFRPIDAKRPRLQYMYYATHECVLTRSSIVTKKWPLLSFRTK